MNTIRKLREDALGNSLHKFFQQAGTEEREEELADILWPAVSRYKESGELSFAAIVCPEYNRDYTKVLSGASTTAVRAINMFMWMKKLITRQIHFTKQVHFRVSLFDCEHRQFDMMNVSPEEANACLDASAKEIARRIRKTGILTENFKAERLVGLELASEWQRIFGKACEHLRSGDLGPYAPFDHPDAIFGRLHDFYRKVMNTEDKAAHRAMFETEEAPGYMSTGHFLRKKHGSHTILIDVGSNKSLSEMTLWQPPEEKLVDQPGLIRIKHPRDLDN